ncbi:MAG: response regulator transcription factor [Ruminococcaceae bacterium]|nr:response regulator transcription factor [Oscillospiraceae bacterium]
MARILIVEDDDSIRELVEMNLNIAGHKCETAADGREALSKIALHTFDLAVLDIMLPEADGYELLPHMQKADIPVIFVSAKGQEMDRVKGLRLGAEDYLVKPFSVLELLVRIEKIIGRRMLKSDDIEILGVRLCPKERQVWSDGLQIDLKPMEYELLHMLMKHPNIVFTREQLLREVWGDLYFGETRTVDNHIAILRRKLNWSERIVTVHRVGYKLEVKA